MAYLDYNGLAYFKQKNDALYAKATDLSNLSDVVAQKANIDGSYESMTVGNAEQLVSSVGIEDQTPYNFRTSGGSTEIGDREELNAVVGVSVPWNQYCDYDETTPTANWSLTGATLSISGRKMTITSSSNSSTRKGVTLRNFLSTANHKYLVSGYITPDASNNAVYGFYNAGVAVDRKIVPYADGKTDISTVFGISASGYDFEILTANSTPSGSSCVAEDVMLIDLTLDLGSTIADYIYSLEQANAGAGVAWFRKYFPKLYYGYSAPTMQSVKTSAHKMVGRNAYNPTSGTAKLLGGYQYEIFGTYSSVSYTDIDGNIETLSFTDVTANNVATKRFTPTNNGTLTVTGGDSTSTCVALVWDGEKAGIYEPYEAHEYALDDITLRGILKLDANNNLYANGDRYLPDGTVERKYIELTFNGTEAWGKESATWNSNGLTSFYLSLSQADRGVMASTSTVPNLISDAYRTASNAQLKTSDTYGLIGFSGGSGLGNYLEVLYNADSAEAFKAHLSSNPLTVVYERATPTTETADPYQQTQIVDDFGTEEFVDAAVEAGERDVAIMVGNETVYKPNLRAKLEMMPDSPSDGDGDYIVRQTNGQNAYIPLVEVKELPDFPSSDGSYKLRCTVTDGTATLSWVSDS